MPLTLLPPRYVVDLEVASYVPLLALGLIAAKTGSLDLDETANARELLTKWSEVAQQFARLASTNDQRRARIVIEEAIAAFRRSA